MFLIICKTGLLKRKHAIVSGSTSRCN